MRVDDRERGAIKLHRPLDERPVLGVAVHEVRDVPAVGPEGVVGGIGGGVAEVGVGEGGGGVGYEHELAGVEVGLEGDGAHGNACDAKGEVACEALCARGLAIELSGDLAGVHVGGVEGGLSCARDEQGGEGCYAFHFAPPGADRPCARA